MHRVARVAARATTIPLSHTPNRLSRRRRLCWLRRLRSCDLQRLLHSRHVGYYRACVRHLDIFMSTLSIIGLLLDRSFHLFTFLSSSSFFSRSLFSASLSFCLFLPHLLSFSFYFSLHHFFSHSVLFLSFFLLRFPFIGDSTQLKSLTSERIGSPFNLKLDASAVNAYRKKPTVKSREYKILLYWNLLTVVWENVEFLRARRFVPAGINDCAYDRSRCTNKSLALIISSLR